MTQDTQPSHEILFHGQWKPLIPQRAYVGGHGYVFDYLIAGTESLVSEQAFQRFLRDGTIRPIQHENRPTSHPTLTVVERPVPGLPPAA